MGELMFLAVLALGCVVVVEGDISHIQVTIEPLHSYAKISDAVIVLCKASVPITQCQFQAGYTRQTSDFSLGHGSYNRSGSRAYYGRGLEAGECGVKVNASRVYKDETVYSLTCRVRNNDSDWAYATTSLFISNSQPIPMTTENRVLVAQPGTELNILFKAQVPLSRCVVEFFGWKRPESLNNFTDPNQCTTPNVCSYGKGLKEMECGISIKNVTEKFNGKIWFNVDALSTSGQLEDVDFAAVIVVKTPQAPVLTVEVSNHEEGVNHLDAVCTVQGSRPAANISWYLDGEPVNQTELQYIPDRDWAGRSLWADQTTKQKLTKRLNDADIGKPLWCVAEHFALDAGIVSRKAILGVTTCPPLTSKYVLISCYLVSEKTDCDQPQRVHTQAHLVCKPGYVKTYDVIYRTITCLKSGKWSRKVFSCVPDCGRRKSNSGTLLISNGEDAKVGEFPWHVGIYHLASGLETPVQICGGSLITTRIVLSAAHCFYDNVLGRIRNSSEFKVAAGKHARGWEEGEGVQRRNVTHIRNRLYGGRDRSFASDIALVRLSEHVEVNAKVNLVCVDWDNVFELWQLRVGGFGVVPGWGFTEEGSPSSELKYIDLPYVPADVCYYSLVQELRPIFTSDKVCAGYRNLSRSVCRGDSGGGLVFLDSRTDKYYVRGIVSVAFRPPGFDGVCYSDQYVGFTLVSQHLTWIQNNIDQ